MIELTTPCKIGVLSDTQVSDPIKRNKFLVIVRHLFSSCNYIFHAGDIIYPILIKNLKKIAPLYAVAGNEDSLKLRTKLPQRIDFQVNKFQLSLLHGHRPILTEAPNIFANRIRFFLGKPPVLKGLYKHVLKSCLTSDCVIFGHSHSAFLEIYDQTLLLNPGAFCHPQEMYNLPPSVAIINIKSLTITASIFTVDINTGSFSKLKIKRLKKD